MNQYDLINGWKLEINVFPFKVLKNDGIFAIYHLKEGAISGMIEFKNDDVFKTSLIAWEYDIEIDAKNKIIHLVYTAEKLAEEEMLEQLD
ncbi:hypothetical protein [Corticicoccus populi]|uniref:Uncharacterized protein n=1 Tax=Corticicoccus populi TaxID=1812821 RepID=A0ABW5WSF6_9STAP